MLALNRQTERAWTRCRPVSSQEQERLQILVVDDDREDYFTVTRMVSQSGRTSVDFDYVDNFSDAIDALRSRSYDLVLLDFFIGHRRGTEVVEAMRNEAIELPIIVLTGSKNCTLERAALEAGAFDFLDKNEMTPALLTRSIDFAVKRFSVESKLRESEHRLRIARENAVNANQSKSEFLAHMSHELRTPLNAIIGFSQMLRDDVLAIGITDKYRDYADTICMSSEHLLSLINNLLDLSKIEAGRYDLTIEKLDIQEMLDVLVEIMRPSLQEKQVELRCDIQSGMTTLYADEGALKQMLLNLASNAVKFSHRGGTVTVRVREDNTHSAISIVDEGVGIEETELKAALSPFEQTTATKRCKAAGTGLGLPITKLLVERHRGTLAIESAPFEGTSVTLRFPKATSALTDTQLFT